VIIYECLLFRIGLVKRALPGVVKLLKRLGAHDYVLRDQSRPCIESHAGHSCSQNALSMSVLFWSKLLPILYSSQLAVHLVTQRSIAGLAARIRRSNRVAGFMFVSCAVPGFVFCLTKQVVTANGSGSRIGVGVASMAGGMATLLVPQQTATRLVVRAWVTTAVLGLAQLSPFGMPAICTGGLRKALEMLEF
jgi:hypothetical protein